MIKACLTSLVALSLLSCSSQTTSEPKPELVTQKSVVVHPNWSKDAVIYQINTRQYSEAGTFVAVEADLPRIKSLGVDILWFMPIHPIGEEKRKGSMGSPYAVKDFRAVNPDLGTLEDFRSVVDAAHALDMKVIIDWVANHTAWDNPLVSDHPEWYTRDEKGEMQHPPETDWLDVVDLDYSQQGLRDYMTDSLVYWVKDVGIDGYRCDVAGMVPTDFWEEARDKLDAVKPVFMLAEWQEPELHERAFNASYAWRWKEILQDIVKGESNAQEMVAYYKDYQTNWPKGAMRMNYTSNHDQNTWDGTPMDIYGEAYEAAIALSFVGEGIPLVYNGQEAGNDKRLEFFEKDLIRWGTNPTYRDLFADFIQLKTKNEVLHNGAWGAPAEFLANDNSKNVLSFVRKNKTDQVLAVFNLSSEAQEVSFGADFPDGIFERFGQSGSITLDGDSSLKLEPWAYRIYTR